MTAAPSRRSKPPAHPVRREGAARSASRRPVAGRAAGGPAQAALAHALAPEPDAFPEGAPGELRPTHLRPKHLQVAPKVSPRVLQQRRRARFAVAGVAALSALSMFLLVTFHVFAAQSSFQLDKLDSVRAAEQRENELLRDQVASLSSATTIYEGAMALHMERPLNVFLLKIPPSGGSGVAATPSSTPVSMPATAYNQLAPGP